MYEYINGTLVEITPTDAIVEAAGVGYDLIISLSTFSKLQGAVGKMSRSSRSTRSAKTMSPFSASPTRRSAQYSPNWSP